VNGRGDAVTAQRLRIGTFNLLHGMDMRTGRVDLAAAAHAIAALRLDVVALQEVDRALPRSGGVDQVAALAAELGLRGVFGPALLGDPDTRWTAIGARDPGGPAYGVGLLSALPIVDSCRAVLPGGGDGGRAPGASPANPGWDREPRTALTGVLDVGGRALRVTSVHLSYLPWRGLAQLRAAARAAVGDGGEPAVLAGDCNLPVWPVRSLLGGAWTHAGGAPTYPAWGPRLQVDQIAVTGSVEIVAVEVAPAGPSDHLAVIATLDVPVG
jgi:endonuclease/exonuclease/phosphatase family metal-dependent hydrolase